MKMRQFLGFLLLVIQATTYCYMTQRIVYPVFITLVGLLVLVSKSSAQLSRSREIIAVFALMIPFALMGRLFPVDVRPELQSGLLYPIYSYTYFMGHYLMTVQVLKYLLRKSTPLPASIPLYGTLAMLCAGNLMVMDDEVRIYQLLGMCFAGVAALYWASCRFEAPQQLTPAIRGRFVWTVSMLLVTFAGAWFSASFVKKYEQPLENLVFGRFDFYTPESGAFGFSKEARLDSMTRLRNSKFENQLVIRVFARQEPGYLRGAAFNEYREGQWRSTLTRKTLHPFPQVPGIPSKKNRSFFNLREGPEGPWKVLHIWPHQTFNSAIFSTLETATLQMPLEEIEIDEHGVPDSGDLIGGYNYSAYIPIRSIPQELQEMRRKEYLSIPETLSGEIHVLASNLFSNCQTAPEKISKVIQYFQQSYQYELGIQVPENEEPLNYFLLKKPGAHCEFFASGAAILLRMAGVPTRYVSGLVVRTWNPSGNFWYAQNRHAHAWVEAYDEREGWVLVEATPSSGIPFPEGENQAASFLDSIKFKLQELQVIIRIEGMKGFLSLLQSHLAFFWAFLCSNSWSSWITRLLLGAVLVRAFMKRRLAKIRFVEKDGKENHFRALLSQMDTAVHQLGMSRMPHETLTQFALRLSKHPELPEPVHDGLSKWYDHYVRVRYRRGHTASELEELAGEMGELQKALRNITRTRVSTR